MNWFVKRANRQKKKAMKRVKDLHIYINFGMFGFYVYSVFLSFLALFLFFFINLVHGSAASLLSGGSSLYGSAEERQANEIRRLKRELCDAREQVMSLSSQLSTNVSNSFRFFICS